MGRRKIEIKAIKDDRNRSVTFLKRKGGLFKKAHELAVLCSVDVAVIIFGHNKKLYEFSSGNINETLNRYSYVCQTYGGPHEHKGPEDFSGKKDGGSDDEDEEDAGDMRPESHSPPQPSMMQHHLQNQPAFQHLGTPSASPPMANGAFHRNASPAPQNLSRPGSRTHFRQPSTHLVPPPPHHIPHSSPQPPQGGFAYMQNQPVYDPRVAAGMQMRPGSGPPHPQYAYSQPPPPSSVPPQHQQQYMAQQQAAPQMQAQQAQQIQQQQAQHAQAHQQEQQQPQRRQSMPPAPTIQIPDIKPPPPSHSPPPTIQQPQFNSPPLPQPKPLSSAARMHSIFTPIDDSRSMLAQHWGASVISSNKDDSADPPPPGVKSEGPRSLSIDTAVLDRKDATAGALRPPIKIQPPTAPTSNPSLAAPQRTSSTPILNGGPAQILNRTNSLGAARPRLKVQIPDEHTDDEGSSKPKTGSGGGSGSPRSNTGATLTPVREHNGVHLPPPSPSASALLSAGATGPPNPFARPAPPNTNGFRGDIDTPISALPSRFVSDQLLPSPSGFYPEWGFGRDNNMLPSPLAFPTPINPSGPSFKDEDLDRKRKVSEGSETSAEKRVKA